MLFPQIFFGERRSGQGEIPPSRPAKKCKVYDKLILRKMMETVATRCHILELKCSKFDFGWGSVLDPAGSLQRSPRPPSWI